MAGTNSLARKRTAQGSSMAKKARSAPNQRKKLTPLYQPVRIYGAPLPLRLRNTMRYHEEIQLVTDAVGYSGYVFSANGMYDPNLTGVGHQPMYFDQLAAIYNHYTVQTSKITATVVRSGVGGHDVQAVIILDDDGNASATSYNTLAERTGAVSWSCAPPDSLAGRTKYYNAQRVFGGNGVDNTLLRGSDSANPSEMSTYIIAVSGPSTSTVNVTVHIEYDVIWSELKSLSGS